MDRGEGDPQSEELGASDIAIEQKVTKRTGFGTDSHY